MCLSPPGGCVYFHNSHRTTAYTAMWVHVTTHYICVCPPVLYVGQAVEAKESVPIQNETVTLASISYQSFFLSYDKLSGMTGTAETELAEFNNIYNLAVAVCLCRHPGTHPFERTTARRRD